jgi:hypothetical protein
MKKKSLSESAFFSFRLVLAAVFCLAGAFVALLGVGAPSSASGVITNGNPSWPSAARTFRSGTRPT